MEEKAGELTEKQHLLHESGRSSSSVDAFEDKRRGFCSYQSES